LLTPIYEGQEYKRFFVDIPSQQCLTQQYEEHIVAESNVLTVFFVLLTVTYSSTLRTERIVPFSWQQWLCERAAVLRYTYIAFLVCTRGLYSHLTVKLLAIWMFITFLYFVTDLYFFEEGIFTNVILLYLLT